MTRLQYTRDAFLRRVAMSYDAAAFLLVEGKVFDRYFVEKVCANSDKLNSAGYQIYMISQIRNDSGASGGGKDAIISLFDYCRKVGKLRQRNTTGERVVAFIADRDAQHITGGMRRSPHLIYTVYADVEAHIFSEADEIEALALAASLDRANATELLGALGDWRRDIADIWRPWIELCYVAAATNASCWVSLSKPKSLIHDGKQSRNLNSELLPKAIKVVRDRSTLDDIDFASRTSHIMSKIESIYNKDRQVFLLKGKWLPAQLTMRVEGFFGKASGGIYEWHAKGFIESVARCYAAKLRVNAPGIQRIRAKLEILL